MEEIHSTERWNKIIVDIEISQIESDSKQPEFIALLIDRTKRN